MTPPCAFAVSKVSFRALDVLCVVCVFSMESFVALRHLYLWVSTLDTVRAKIRCDIVLTSSIEALKFHQSAQA